MENSKKTYQLIKNLFISFLQDKTKLESAYYEMELYELVKNYLEYKNGEDSEVVNEYYLNNIFNEYNDPKIVDFFMYHNECFENYTSYNNINIIKEIMENMFNKEECLHWINMESALDLLYYMCDISHNTYEKLSVEVRNNKK